MLSCFRFIDCRVTVVLIQDFFLLKLHFSFEGSLNNVNFFPVMIKCVIISQKLIKSASNFYYLGMNTFA